MDVCTGRCSRILIATFYLSIIGLTGCSNRLSQQNNTDSTVIKKELASVADNIVEPGTAITYDTSKRYIYITLDDGPQPGTMNCYHTLKDLGVKASFFMIGVQGMEGKSRLKVDSIRNAYPEFILCNHTYTHAYFNKYKLFYAKPDSALLDLERAQDSLRAPLKIFRTPANNSWAINKRYRTPKLTSAFCKAADSLGYKGVGWDVEWRFKGAASVPVQSADEMIREVDEVTKNHEDFTKNHIVILAHDRMFAQQRYVDSLTKFIALLKQDPRNVFETIDHYPGVAKN